MTRASLLHILDHVNGISDAEVRELEQLAAAFPYCQTAHVLLAKAAHDRGSMLASQRLRRAATYAADRNLLRQLLEQPAAVVAAPPLPAPTPPAPEPVVAPEADVFATALPPTPAVEPLSEPAPAAAPETVAEIELSPETEVAPAEAIAEQQVAPELAVEPAPPLAADADLVFPEKVASATEPDEAVSDEAISTDTPELITVELPLPEEAPTEFPDTDATAEVPATTPAEPANLSPEPAAERPLPTEVSAEAEPGPAPEDDILPAVAPPIRPPAEAGISRFEFGLAEPALPPPSGYQLPGLAELDAADDALPTLGALTGQTPPAAPPFRADEEVGYALGAGSRLGYDLQPHDGYTLDLPLDAFFEPDALLLAHVRNNQPKPQASSLDLINRFLKTQPRIKTPAGVPLPAEEQTDLSVRSTKAAPAIASESLAKIMVRQGKKDKAIEIYERLMERQPEKKAYFAEQIQQLQQSPE